MIQVLGKIMAADHHVWVFPVWLGGLPAITKGFIDRIFLPPMAFRYDDKSNRIRGHLQNKTARIVTTLDQSGWTYKWYFGEPSTWQLKQATLQFCGIKKVKTNYMGSIRGSSAAQREKWLQHLVKMAQQDGHSLSVKV
nr:NAD(P)H-dependent oxidoreductase [Acinetobacter brisouii]